MSFISSYFSWYNGADDQFIYAIKDSEFGEIDSGGATNPGFFDAWIDETIAIVRLYSQYDRQVGRNVALTSVFFSKTYEIEIEAITTMQDRHCSKHFPNWSQYAKERDDALEKLLPLL